MNYVSKENMADILTGIAQKIGQGGTGSGLEDWQASHEYAEKDICVYEGQIYRAKVGFTSDTTFSTTQILEEYTPVGGETITPYAKDTEISIDDIVSYDNNTYKALYNFVCGEEFSLYALQEYVPIELTDDDIKEIVGAYDPVVEEAKGVEYSTEERKIGTWIDGKPLYQKTFQGTIQADATFAHDDVQRDMVSIVDTMWDSSGDYAYGVNYFNSSGTYTFFYYTHSSQYGEYPNSISVISNRDADIGRTAYVTLQYTKTTDGGGGLNSNII